ncbi:hypothetical protein AAJ76_600062268 [Vairimorpha ceranae]|uniref:FHA domain-containing protein n=1 Tax=Vairimorpha ceranae TaxID=40302 RepID=A0A0F9YUL8_9MICR|nr:hypothetical protein AAJ76_600062268 [Vairimorpha ceranae]KAF5140078.1 hypothetical protein G9O61_00g018030 [Vairimorpha ceranae]KKO76152.1 hypothetical protein AAJ76_600062268 [Vairimorpha ceranae]
MSYKYTLDFYNLKNNKIKSYHTNADIISIGSGLFNSIRIQIPSILELHIKIFLDKKKILVFGEDVTLKNEELKIGYKYDFELGDSIKIHERTLRVRHTDYNELIDKNNIVKESPDTLKDVINYQEIGADLFINGNENKFSINSENNYPQEMMTNGDEKKNKKEMENNVNDEGNTISSNLNPEGFMQPKNQEYMEIINEENVEIMNEEEVKMDKKEEEVKMDKKENEIKNIYIEDNEIIASEVCGNIKTERETNIHREVVSSHYIKEGVIYEEVKENVQVEDLKKIELQENETMKDTDSEIKNNFEVQAAAKIIDASSSETKVEDALENDDINYVKEAITSKQQDLDEKINDCIDVTAVDTPINPFLLKKQPVDLGDVIIEKEILKDAEKIVEEKINQSSENLNLSEQENVTEEPLNEVKEEKVPEISEYDLNLTKQEQKVEEGTVFIKEKEENNMPILTEQDIKNINQNNESLPVKKQTSEIVPVTDNTATSSSENLKGIEDDKVNINTEKANIVEDTEPPLESIGKDEVKNFPKKNIKKTATEDSKPIVDDVNKAKQKRKASVKNVVVDENKKSEPKRKKVEPEKEVGSGFENLSVENQKPKTMSKLTLTPRSTRKASMTTNQKSEVPNTAISKRVRRNASVSSDSKSSAEDLSKKNKKK